MCYYVVIGRLMTRNKWEQDYIIPFDSKEKAEEYIEYFKASGAHYDCFITVTSSDGAPSDCEWALQK